MQDVQVNVGCEITVLIRRNFKSGRLQMVGVERGIGGRGGGGGGGEAEGEGKGGVVRGAWWQLDIGGGLRTTFRQTDRATADVVH